MFYLLILLLQMKLIKRITDLNKAIGKEKDLGFIPTMGCIHKGHESLIKVSQKLCKKTLVSIFVNPTQFNSKYDYKSYPRNINQDLIALKRLKVDFVYLPSVNQIYKKKRLTKITLNKAQKVMCAKFRKGHFEGVLDVLDRFVKLISPRMMFMGEKDHQQYFLTHNFISKKYKTIIYLCRTIRDVNGIALSSRNILLNMKDIKIAGLISNKLTKLKRSISKNNRLNNIKIKRINEVIKREKINLVRNFHIKIEYLECRNIINFSKHLNNKPFKLFLSYYLGNVRLIDNF
ncbi:pantoate--beta-alanine ligase [Candidatus Pelagibacter sp.]|nr:pantoate--beta-alanine ligase [Candidatus Pelagibacter sp.]